MSFMLQMVENSETHNITLFVLISAIVAIVGFIAAAVVISITHHNRKKPSRKQPDDKTHTQNAG